MVTAPLPDLMALSRYDDDLRQVAADAPALEKAIEEARRQLADLPADPGSLDIARLESYIGEALRILGRHDEAIGAQRSALARLREADFPRQRLVYALRLAEAQRVSGDLLAAEQGFRDGLATVRNAPELANYEDFTLQHLGKCLLDQGRLDEAEATLRKGLVIRQRKKSPELIASTEVALALVDRRRSLRSIS